MGLNNFMPSQQTVPSIGLFSAPPQKAFSEFINFLDGLRRQINSHCSIGYFCSHNKLNIYFLASPVHHSFPTQEHGCHFIDQHTDLGSRQLI
jgi:hypothetical protein